MLLFLVIWRSEVKSLHLCPTLQPHGLNEACQAPPPMRFFRQEYWSGLPFPSSEDVPDPGIEPGSPTLQADSTIWVTREFLIWRRQI